MALPGTYRRFLERFPQVGKAYEGLGEACKGAGPLDEKTQQLVKLALAIGARSEGSVHSHARRALEAGATREELEHVVALAITSVGFAQAIAAWTWVCDVL
ncbi:MAG TPA: carboxymuconolactone decarboxylase family protein [Candidatus Nitrosotenuis sp.]|jgi:AhpD family alkylhydroperoxidase|nr:carboxymuconolactone decarboxylase family protein [Candidatus Nitrosotenuis sp.]